MTEREPEYVWAFPPEKRRGGRGWVIGALVVAAVVIALVAFLLIVKPWGPAEPVQTPSPSPSVAPTSASPSATPTASATPTTSPTPTETPTRAPSPQPTATSPAPVDPALPVFRDKMQPLLDDASTGLGYASDSDAQEGAQIADQLRGDAGRMSDAVAPRSIADQWAQGVRQYGTALDDLRSAFENGAATSGPLSAARSALENLQSLVDG